MLDWSTPYNPLNSVFQPTDLVTWPVADPRFVAGDKYLPSLLPYL
jgi:hypothetical protein